MSVNRAYIAEIKDRGQLTIPKKIRDLSHLEEVPLPSSDEVKGKYVR